MLKNYVKIALRKLRKYKTYTCINIIVLACGMACCILILLWVQHELSYDRFYKNAKTIYRIIEEFEFTDGQKPIYGALPALLAPAIKESFPEVDNIARFMNGGQVLVQSENHKYFETGIALADQSFFNIFTLSFIRGNPASALNDPYSIVLTEEIANKYFGTVDVLGKIINLGGTEEYKVSAILKNVPSNTHIQFDMLVPFMEGRRLGLPPSQVLYYYTYVQLYPNTTENTFNAKIKDFFSKVAPNAPAKVTLSLQPLTRIHLYSNFSFDMAGHGDITYVILFSIIACMVLLIACINFMNLSTARSGTRATEAGIRKVLGGHRIDLIYQFYAESVLLCGLALVIALIFVDLFVPIFNQLTGQKLSFNVIKNWEILAGILVITFMTAIISGSYPALILSAFQPVKVLKGRLRASGFGLSVRRYLVIFQFSISIALIISTIIISQQLNYVKNKKLVFEKDQIIYIPLRDDVKQKKDILRDELIKHSHIAAASVVSELPTNIERCSDYLDWDGKAAQENILMNVFGVDYTSKDVFQFKLVLGRFFSPDFPTDIIEGYLLNQTAVETIGMISPIGERFSLWNREGRIIGVVEDFHFRSLHQKIEPLIFKMFPEWSNYLCIKVNPTRLSDVIPFIENRWNIIVSTHPLEFHFLNHMYENLYMKEIKIQRLFHYFSLFAILISSLGLFGLTSFIIEQRTKEIDVRKVLGATVSGIVLFLSKEFIRWVLIANLIAWPIAYIAMSKWLQNFAYRINIGWWTFFSAGLLVLVIALITVSYQSIKAALANPVESLRYE